MKNKLKKSFIKVISSLREAFGPEEERQWVKFNPYLKDHVEAVNQWVNENWSYFEDEKVVAVVNGEEHSFEKSALFGGVNVRSEQGSKVFRGDDIIKESVHDHDKWYDHS